MGKLNLDENIPTLLIIYSIITVIVAVFAPSNVPESVRISILVSSQTSLGGAAGMSRTGNKGKEINNKIDNVDNLIEQPDDRTNQHYISSENNQPYK